MDLRVFGIALMSLVLASCAESAHQRERMELENGRSHAFAETPAWSNLNEANSSPSLSDTATGTLQLAQGQSVTLFGLVLNAKRRAGFTEIDILQLPADADGRPTEDRRQSQGRFFARQTTFLDPAILATKPMVTVQGVVEGEVERPLEPGSDNDVYPIVLIQTLTIWPHELRHSNVGSFAPSSAATALSQPSAGTDFMSNFLGALIAGIGKALFNPSRYDYRSPYNHSYYSSPSSSASSPSPSPPPEKDIPPQFRKGH